MSGLMCSLALAVKGMHVYGKIAVWTAVSMLRNGILINECQIPCISA